MAARTSLYFTIWRWHFYAGLFVTPFVLILAATGSIYLFRTEIDDWLKPEWAFVTNTPSTVPAQELLEHAAAKFPGMSPAKYSPPLGPGRTAAVQLVNGLGESQVVFLNPHTGVAIASVNPDHRFTEVIRQLHGKLLMGWTGQLFVEMVASWAFVMILTGLYLWWPRAPLSIWGALLPRLRAGGRTVLRDLHSIGAVVLSAFVVFLIVTGLPWAVIGAKQIELLQANIHEKVPMDLEFSWPAPDLPGNVKKASQAPASHHGAARTRTNLPGETETRDWLDSQSPVRDASTSSAPANGRSRLGIEQIIAKAESLAVPRYEIRIPQSDSGVYMVTTRSKNPRDKRLIYIDQYSGWVMNDFRWSSFGPFSRAVSLGVSIHQGDFFGLPNQLLGVLTTVGLMAISILGIVMWWKRRPRGRLGVPQTPKNAKMAASVTAIVLVCAVAMPLIAASLLIAVILDIVVVSQWGELRRFLR